jgi:hypothetical protein
VSLIEKAEAEHLKTGRPAQGIFVRGSVEYHFMIVRGEEESDGTR